MKYILSIVILFLNYENGQAQTKMVKVRSMSTNNSSDEWVPTPDTSRKKCSCIDVSGYTMKIVTWHGNKSDTVTIPPKKSPSITDRDLNR